MKLNEFPYFYSDPLGNHTLKIMKKIPGNLLKKTGKIMEISWNFVNPKKWEPWIYLFTAYSLICVSIYKLLWKVLLSVCNKGILQNLWRRMHLRDWAPEKHQLLLSESKRHRYEVNYHPGVFTKSIVVHRSDVYEERSQMGKRNTHLRQLCELTIPKYNWALTIAENNIKWNFFCRQPQSYIIQVGNG